MACGRGQWSVPVPGDHRVTPKPLCNVEDAHVLVSDLSVHRRGIQPMCALIMAGITEVSGSRRSRRPGRVQRCRPCSRSVVEGPVLPPLTSPRQSFGPVAELNSLNDGWMRVMEGWILLFVRP